MSCKKIDKLHLKSKVSMFCALLKIISTVLINNIRTMKQMPETLKNGSKISAGQVVLECID